MQVTHSTALVVIPPGSAWAPIQAIRAEHDRKVGRWMPPITLVYPFLPAGEFERAAGRLGPGPAAPVPRCTGGVSAVDAAPGYSAAAMRESDVAPSVPCCIQ
jgi:hypothetical protein